MSLFYDSDMIEKEILADLYFNRKKSMQEIARDLNCSLHKVSYWMKLGIGLYWGEGNKKNIGSIRLGNTNPRLICSFVEFLIKIFGINVPKLRFGLQIFSDIQQAEALNFWLG